MDKLKSAVALIGRKLHEGNGSTDQLHGQQEKRVSSFNMILN